MPSTISPYQTALDLRRPRPAWVPNEQDADRVTVYHTYDDIFNNVKEAFTAILRDADGEEVSRRYVPAARSIIEATNRYLAKRAELVSVVPPDVTLSEEDQAAQMAFLEALWVREEVGTKFLSLKRWMLVRGDALFHVTADPSKPEGSRIRINILEPDHYFPIHDEMDPTRVVGAYVVSIVLGGDDGTEQMAQRIEYRKVRTPDEVAEFNGAPVGSIFYRVGYFKPDAWDDRAPSFTAADLEPVDEIPDWALPAPGSPDYLAGYALPTAITAIPLYHFRNNRTDNEPFGRSELQGIETLLGGITATMTDEDIAVALQGLGVFTTDSGHPKDERGNDVDWIIAPGSVVELEDGKKFTRVAGIDDLKPLLQHVDQLSAMARETTATPDVAVGRVDVQVAESGVALAIEMAPILAKNEEKEDELKNKMDQMLFGLLNGWFVAYEGMTATGLVVEIHFGQPLPVNEDAIVTQVSTLVEKAVIPVRFALQLLKDKLGWDIDPVALAAELQTQQQASIDAAGARIDAALGNPAASAGGVPAGE